MPSPLCPGSFTSRLVRMFPIAALLAAMHLAAPSAIAQSEPMQPGEGFLTRFSGTRMAEDLEGKPTAIIDPQGISGAIVDLRQPGRPPRGEHMIDEPQKAAVTAADVGQIFGIAIDDTANIYVTATSAFGLHLAPDGSGWMAGMWGADGGPGTVYRLDAENGYAPAPFFHTGTEDRENTGAALGNIAFDPWNQQLYVSDLESGRIHRIKLPDGADLGYWDHGTAARPNFIDAASGETQSLPPVPFNPESRPKFEACQGDFEKTPACWNFADYRRRVWGLGVRQDLESGQVRLFYSVWSSQALGSPDWASAAEEDKLNAVWSVAILDDGGFDTASVRREFYLPDFHLDPERIAEGGLSNPVSDIAFPRCGQQNVMLLAERGGIRNLGLDAAKPFTHPSEARSFLYEIDENGTWRPVGRYDVGTYDRRAEGQPYLRANCAGGADFGPGITEDGWKADTTQFDGFVWITGDKLCSADEPCVLPGTDEREDFSEVHGVQGLSRDGFDEVAPAAAFEDYPQDKPPYPPAGPDQSYMIDAAVNVDGAGNPIPETFTRDNASKIGDIEIFQLCEEGDTPPPDQAQADPLPPPPPPPPQHTRDLSHGRYGSTAHTRARTHRRWGSPVHSRARTHDRYGSLVHHRWMTHRRAGSPVHSRSWSHRRYGSTIHTRSLTHRRWGSPVHTRAWTHRRYGSPYHSRAWTHRRWGSPIHTRTWTHRRWGSPVHTRLLTHRRWGSPVHTRWFTHIRAGSPVHTRALTHRRFGSLPHSRGLSHGRYGSVHTKRRTHLRAGSLHGRGLSHNRYASKPHTTRQTHRRFRSNPPGHLAGNSHRRHGSQIHTKKQSHARKGSAGPPTHTKKRTHRRHGSPAHSKKRSHDRTGSAGQTHSRKKSHARRGSTGPVHGRKKSHARQGSFIDRPQHGKKKSHARKGSSGQTHTKKKSHARKGSSGQTHTKKKSHARKGSSGQTHTKKKSHARKGSSGQTHTKKKSHARKGSSGQTHTKKKSHARKGSSGQTHTKKKSHARKGSSGQTHTKKKSHARKGSSGQTHTKKKSHARKGSSGQTHTKKKSHARKGSSGQTHTKKKSHARLGSSGQTHGKSKSHARKGSSGKTHSKSKTHAKNGSNLDQDQQTKPKHRKKKSKRDQN